MNPQEFANKIKAKYPQYEGIDDVELTKRVIDKYPVYASQVNLEDGGGGFVEGAKDVAKGFVKRTASTLQNIGNVVAKPALKALGVPEDEIGIPEESLKLKNKAQKFGGFASDVATLAVPGSKAGSLAKGLVARTATEAAIGGGVTAAQQGGFGKESRDAAILSAIFPAAGKALQLGRRLTQSAQKELAPRVVNSLIKPLQKDLSYGKNPGRSVAEMGIVANSLEELADNIATTRNTIGSGLSDLYRQSNAIIDVPDFLAPLDEAIAKANKAPRTNSALISRLQGLKDDLLGVEINELGEAVARRQTAQLTAQEVFDLKREVGDLTRFTGNVSDDNITNSALRRVYGVLKGKLDKALPDTVKLNERYADLTSAEIATKYRDKIAQRANLIKFDVKAAGVGGGILAALATGGAGLPTLIVGLGSAGLQKALETPRVKTEFAKWLAKTPAASKKALFDKAPWIKATILRSIVGE